MIAALIRWALRLQYEHLRAGMHAMQIDMQTSERITTEQHQALARMQAKALAVLRRINALTGIARV